jgi:hypothetical protein
MTRHGMPAAIAVTLVLLGSVLQILTSRGWARGGSPRPTSATVVNVVAPAGLLFVASAVAYVRLAGGRHGPGTDLTTTLVAVALFASAAYTSLVAVIALAVAVVAHGVRRAWASLWVVTAASVTAAVLLPIGWGR